jgi:hypothetical protein
MAAASQTAPEEAGSSDEGRSRMPSQVRSVVPSAFPAPGTGRGGVKRASWDRQVRSIELVPKCGEHLPPHLHYRTGTLVAKMACGGFPCASQSRFSHDAS